MFYAAQRFSQHVAYPGKEFPFTEGDSRCVLCQQTLDVDAKVRLERFWDFIISDVQKQSEESTAEFEAKRNTLNNVPLRPESGDPEILDEIGIIDPGLKKLTLTYIQSIEPRVKGIKKACDTGEWINLPTLPESPTVALKSASEVLKEQIKELLTFINQRIAVEAELLDLEARQYLSKEKTTVLRILKQMKIKHYCEECTKCLNTRSLTDTQNHLMAKAVTSKLREKLSKELKKLNVDYLGLDVANKGEKGSTLIGLQMSEGNPKSVYLSDILSEGEQRAVAIASFLAEIEATGFQSGIVFDDPVSSLDHRFRERVAKRLVEEAKKRQVIVFTHDIVFLLEIVECANRERVPIMPRRSSVVLLL